MSLYACLTSREWMNLCSAGRIRLHESRVVGDPEHASHGTSHELFALAPDRFGLGESADLLVAEVNGVRIQQEGTEPGARHHGMRWLLLEDVIAFFPVRADDAWVFEADAESAQIMLSQPRFEGLWKSWTKAERQRQACINGTTLARHLGLLDEGAVGPEDMAWSDLASLAIDPKGCDPRFSGLTASLLLNRDKLFNEVREDTDSSAIFVSCSVKWTNLHSGAEVLELERDLKGRAHSLYERYRGIPFDMSTVAEPELACFLKDLASTMPAAFSDEWRPATVTLYARYFQRMRFGKPTPDEVVGVVRAAEVVAGRRPARLLAFLLGVAMESNRVHDLARQLRPDQFPVAVPAPSVEPEQAPVSAAPPEAATSGHAEQLPPAPNVPDEDRGPDAEGGPG